MYNRFFSHIILAAIVIIWVVPFVALITTSFRSEVASKTSGFWTAFTPTELGHRFSTHDKGQQIKIIEMRGNIFERINENEEWFTISGEIKSISDIKNRKSKNRNFIRVTYPIDFFPEEEVYRGLFFGFQRLFLISSLNIRENSVFLSKNSGYNT